MISFHVDSKSSFYKPKRKILSPTTKFEKIKEEEQNAIESEIESDDCNTLIS